MRHDLCNPTLRFTFSGHCDLNSHRETQNNYRSATGQLTNAVAFAIRLLPSSVHAVVQSATLRKLSQGARVRLNYLHDIGVVLRQPERSRRLVLHQRPGRVET